MKIEFNPDGSIKIPKNPNISSEDDNEFNKERVIRFIRKPISDKPLIDELKIEISSHVENPERIESLFKAATGKFLHMAQLSLSKIQNRNYVVRIVSGQYRDTWIHNFMEFVKLEMKVKIQYWGGIHDFRKGNR